MSEGHIEADRSQLELDILYKISQALTHQHDVSSLLNEVLDIMERFMQIKGGRE